MIPILPLVIIITSFFIDSLLSTCLSPTCLPPTFIILFHDLVSSASTIHHLTHFAVHLPPLSCKLLLFFTFFTFLSIPLLPPPPLPSTFPSLLLPFLTRFPPVSPVVTEKALRDSQSGRDQVERIARIRSEVTVYCEEYGVRYIVSTLSVGRTLHRAHPVRMAYVTSCVLWPSVGSFSSSSSQCDADVSVTLSFTPCAFLLSVISTQVKITVTIVPLSSFSHPTPSSQGFREKGGGLPHG